MSIHISIHTKNYCNHYWYCIFASSPVFSRVPVFCVVICRSSFVLFILYFLSFDLGLLVTPFTWMKVNFPENYGQRAWGLPKAARGIGGCWRPPSRSRGRSPRKNMRFEVFKTIQRWKYLPCFGEWKSSCPPQISWFSRLLNIIKQVMLPIP